MLLVSEDCFIRDQSHLGRFDVEVRDEEAASSSLGCVVVVGEGALAGVEAAPAPPARAVVGVGGQEVDLNRTIKSAREGLLLTVETVTRRRKMV